MRYHEIIDSTDHRPGAVRKEAGQQPFSAEHRAMIAGLCRSLAEAGFKMGFIDDARRSETPHVVDCMGLSDEVLPCLQASQELLKRRDWCREHCGADFEIEPIRDGVGRLVGRRFRFSDLSTATLFKLRFEIRLIP